VPLDRQLPRYCQSDSSGAAGHERNRTRGGHRQLAGIGAISDTSAKVSIQPAVEKEPLTAWELHRHDC
jgi:hypothetical protein